MTRYFFLPLIAAVLFAGCNSGSDAPETAAVSGQVTLEGTPLEGAAITFVDPAGKTGGASGVTDKNGNYSMTYGANTGVVPGSYNVVISHLTSPDGTPLKIEEGMDVTQLEMQGLTKQSLPATYTDPQQTVLKAEVKAGTSNQINFPLKKDGTAP